MTCGAYVNGQTLPGASELLIKSGSVTDTSTPGVRRTLELELVPVPGLFELLQPTGIQLRPVSSLQYSSAEVERIPMGVYDLTTANRAYGPDGSIRVTAYDKWVLIQRATFEVPYSSNVGLSVSQQIAALIRDALGPGENVTITATSQAAVGPLVWDEDRDKAINDLAESIGAWVYFDRDGVATIADLPTLVSPGSAWSVDAGSNGVLLNASRGRDRSKTRNVVVVNPENADGAALFEPQVIADTAPSSPTFVGGSFGRVPYRYSSPLIRTAEQAQQAGQAILGRVTGLNAQLSLSAVRNHALDALDTIDVQLPRERYDIPIPVERHLIDKIVHPLMPTGEQQIDTRSTRTDTL